MVLYRYRAAVGHTRRVIFRLGVATIGCVAAIAALTACSSPSFAPRNTIPGVAVSTESSAAVGQDGGSLFQPASGNDARITAKAAIAVCGTACAAKPNQILLARLGDELGSEAGTLAWVIEYKRTYPNCLVASYGPPPQPGTTMYTRPVIASCTVYQMVDATTGGGLNTLVVGH